MKLQEILDLLANGELSQISIGGQDAGVINAANREKVVGAINLALTALHTRFNLREGRLTVHLNENVTIYQLDKSKVGLTPTETKYLEQNGQLFALKDTLLKVERVYTEAGKELDLNVLSNPFTLRTPRYDLLEVPEVMVREHPNRPDILKTSTLEVYYRANHPKLGKWANGFPDDTAQGEDDAEFITVDLPNAYLTALCFWVASRFMNPTGMANEFHAGNSYYAKYEAECQRIEAEGLEVDGADQPGFRRPGWA